MTTKKKSVVQQVKLFTDDVENQEDRKVHHTGGGSRIVYSIVKPEMLKWGRQYAYLTITDAAHRIGVTVEKLREWENNVSSPTIPQLHKIARVYNQLFAVFYLQTPPRPAKLPLKDFRRVPSTGTSEITHELASEVRTAINRREIAVRMLEEMEEEPVYFHLTAQLLENPSNIAEKVRNLVFSDLSEIPSFSNKSNAFRFYRERLEHLGILVFQSSTVSISEMRGFSIFEPIFPVIVVNRKDSPAGRVFSLFHELTHLLLRTAGLCEIDFNSELHEAEQDIEVFCNQVAAEILMPQKDFLDATRQYLIVSGDSVFTDTIILKLSNKFGVSREAIVRRLLTLGLVTKDFYQQKRNEYLQELSESSKTKRKNTIRISPARTIISLAGKTYVSLVLGAIGQNRITLNDASGFLNVRIKQISNVSRFVGM